MKPGKPRRRRQSILDRAWRGLAIFRKCIVCGEWQPLKFYNAARHAYRCYQCTNAPIAPVHKRQRVAWVLTDKGRDALTPANVPLPFDPDDYPIF